MFVYPGVVLAFLLFFEVACWSYLGGGGWESGDFGHWEDEMRRGEERLGGLDWLVLLGIEVFLCVGRVGDERGDFEHWKKG